MAVTFGGCPLDCPDACSWLVTVNDGKAEKIRGNPDHPFTQGELCKKVNPWLTYAADESRLLQPQRRVGAKGAGRFETISWDEAIGEMADRLSSIVDRSGGGAVWPFVGTGHQGWIQGSRAPSRIWTRMGAANNHGSICAIGGAIGMGYTTGSGGWMEPEEFADAGLVLIWGSNTKITNRHLWPFIEQARSNGAPVVVVDPLRTRTAEAADHYFSLRPGTDGALILGLCREIVRNGGADERFLAERCFGWDEFSEALDEWTLGRTAEVTGLSARDIGSLAQMITNAPPLAVRAGQGIQRHANGGQAMRTVSCLPAITGAYDHLGGGMLYSLGGERSGFNLERGQRPELGQRARTLATTNLGENLLSLTPPVEALVLWGANPMVSNPETQKVRAGLSREDLFTVVIEIFPTETTLYADLVLPSTMQHEHLDMVGSYHHGYIQWNEPAVAPAGESLAHTEIFRRLAAAMGYTEPELFASDEELAADLLDSAELRADGFTLEHLRDKGYLAVRAQEPPARRRFATGSGRFEFVSAAAESQGQGRLPLYRPPTEAAALAPGSLALIAAAGDHHINSTFAGTDKTRAGRSEPPIQLHPDDAQARGIADGDMVSVANERGSFTARALISAHTRPGVAATTKGWWGHPINNTVVERDADMGSGARFHDNAVHITLHPTAGNPQGSPLEETGPPA